MTTITDQPIDADFEAELRSMLERRAADVEPGAFPVPRQRAGDTKPGPASTVRPMRPGRNRRQPLVAAAAAVVVLAGGVGLAAVATSSDGGDDTAVGSAAVDDQAFPTPGSEGWDPATAPPVWPVLGEAGLRSLAAGQGSGPAVELGDPAAVVTAYLDAVASPVAIAAAAPTVAADGHTATADWAFTDEPALDDSGPTYSGTIFLRRFDAPDGPGWVVVGSTTRSSSPGTAVLSDVRSDGEHLRFTVSPDPVTGDSMAVRARVNAAYVSVGGEPLPQGSSPDLRAGELVTFGDGNRMELELDAEPGDRVEILVRHVGGTWLSLTHMAVDLPAAGPVPPEAPATPAPSSTVAPPAAADAETPPSQATPPTTAPPVTVEHVEGTYRGTEQFAVTTGRCPTLDHVLDSTFSLSDGSTWRYHSDYCGRLDGTLWTGTGTFTFTTSTGDTITGSFDDSAQVPSEGEPFDLSIGGGTGAYEGASGSCHLDNHLLQHVFGTQQQSGTFTCDIVR
jgi:hypothetical protein